MKAGLPKLSLAFFCLFVSVGRLRAQALYPVGLDEKVKHASLIVEGIVEGQVAFWNKPHTMIFTANNVRVYKVFEGTVSASHIQVLTQGGTVGGFNVEASDVLNLQTGDVGIFFCFPNELKMVTPGTGEMIYDVYSSAQGCYKYDVTKMAADAPFEKFSSITGGLYQAITSRTGKNLLNKMPSVSFDTPPATTGAGLNAVTDFTPKVVNAGALLQPDSNLLTITGTGFGTPSGTAAILFDDPDNGTGGTPFTLAATSNLIVSWTDLKIQVKVPPKVGTGIFTVRNSTGTLFSSVSPLTINYAVLAPIFNSSIIIQSNLMNTNGLGGYDIVYSASTLGGGRNLTTAPEKETFQRALITWKQVCGANIREAGATENQVINGNDNVNTVVLDNTNTTVPVLPSGTLAITYSFNTTCTVGGQFVYPAQKVGFDILIRNSPVSAGSTKFTMGPCPPASNIVETDMEMVIMHELGHAINLGHINDSFEGTALPNINPGKLMNYAIVNNVKRISPDYSAKSGADYSIRQKGFDYGSCNDHNQEMTPLTIFFETKDECPLEFPQTPTLNNTTVDFDLVNATSNFHADPQFTAVDCSGRGTGVTNTAYYVLRTNDTDSAFTISVSDYATSPATQADCPVAGIELALYRVSSCPDGQNFPDPVACRTFNANGVLSNFTDLEKNVTYLLMVDGIANTKANFTLTFNGSVLPVKIKDFYGNITGADNRISWEFDALTEIGGVSLERSTNGRSFETISNWNSASFALKGYYTDKQAPVSGFYRLLFVSRDGKKSYSNVINLNRIASQAWRMYPNPAKEKIYLYAGNVSTGKYTVQVFTSGGILVLKQVANIAALAQLIQLPVTGLSSGGYRVIVAGQNGETVYNSSVTVVK